MNLTAKYFAASYLTLGVRDLSGFQELQDWLDNDSPVL
jgi:hypothetical protein